MPSPLTHDDPAALGPYRLIARLGSGGMGTVYLGRSPGGRTLALKTMHARIATQTEFRTRFRLESDAARVIGGRHGAQVVDADPLAETPWMATEYVIGPPLDEAVALAGPLPETTVRALGAALCGALGQLHRSDVVHRDLKPSNIMVTAYGPKVIDFGIARALGDDRLTHTGAAVGTPAFMSPEQATGQEHTPAGDVFALAGVLVFAATGRGPFGNGRPADLLYRVRYAEPDLTGVPAALAGVLARCLAKDPADRPDTEWLATQLQDGTGDFADRLPDPVLAEIGRRANEVWQVVPQRLPAPPDQPATVPSAEVPAPSGPSRRGLLMAGAGSVLGVAGAGAGVWAWLSGGGPAPGPTGPYEKPKPGPSVSALKKKKLDSLWQIQTGGTEDEESPAAPFMPGDAAVLLAPTQLYRIDPASGAVTWTADIDGTWQVASDGRNVYQNVRVAHYEHGSAFPSTVSRYLSRVDLTTGKAGKHLAEVTDPQFGGIDSQLLAVAGGTAYLAISLGKVKEYLRQNPWAVTAVDLATGSRRWTERLAFRSQKSDRNHFLAATVVGDRLLLLQERNDGTVRIVVRDTRTGKVDWDRPWDGIEPAAARQPLTADGGHLYLGSGRLRALRLSDGRQTWAAPAGTVHGVPLLKDGVVYAVQQGRGLVGTDARSGKPRWAEKGGDGARASLTSRPVIGSRCAYTYHADEGALRAIDRATRTTARLYKANGDRFTAQERGKVILASGKHFLAAFPLQ
ncbi:protein kinase domain-containing protein [Streptomyces bugieae]|uniref:PQQ-binding-like beta-propeller repeat protein n=1 Tax=Streptomyces bugieae TaxID=3098223 RepID=A0ABU7NXT3_9ACTN|nr:PQQ-binding-like beta-propeller repeat protein [Streptomyces sp. DSM 41528]